MQLMRFVNKLKRLESKNKAMYHLLPNYFPHILSNCRRAGKAG